MRRKTNEEFQQEVHDLVGNDYTFLECYQGASTKIKVKHNTCGHTYIVTPTHFLTGERCPLCHGNHKKTNEQFKKEIYDLVGDEYKFLDSYVNYHTKLRVKHNKCGNVYEVAPSDFISSKRCPFCFGTHKKTNDQFQQEIYDLVGDEYTFLDSYVNAITKIKVKHNLCGNIYKVKPANFLTGKRCPFCAGNIKKTTKQFSKELIKLEHGEYQLIGKYVNSGTKVKIKHNKCGNIYGVTPNNFLTGYRCPYCNSPKGETLISKILNTLNINYEYQKTFDDLKDTTYLSYDFFIPNQAILIEYQGIQHYQPVDRFGGESQFKLQQKHDQMKADYAKSHHYNLIAVPYTEDTFSKIKKYLIRHGLYELA